MAIVEVDRYSFAYPADCGAVPVLSEVSFEVARGDFCVLVGPTGCGKTTLLRSLKPELAPAGVRAGSIRVCDAWLVKDGETSVAERYLCDECRSAAPVLGMPSADSAACIGFVAQDPETQLVCDTVWHELAFGLENLGIPSDEMRRRVAEVAHFFGIEPWMHAGVEALSGGQKQLVNLAAALVLRPKLLLLDEPTAQLDPNACKQFLFMLARVNRELGVTVVMTTHEPEDVALYATEYIELGSIGIAAHRQQALDALGCCGNGSECFACHGGGGLLRRESDEALGVSEVHFRYGKHDPWVLRGVDVRIRKGSVHALVGGNGSGKTTLLKLMAGVLKPQRGKVKNTLAHCQALLPQDPKTLFVCDTVAEELAEWRTRCGYSAQDEVEMLQRFGLSACVDRHPYDLSGGQQQKLALAKLLLCKPQLLFMDEPTKGLDPASCADACRIVRDLASVGCTVVLVTHDLDFAALVADSVTMLFDGQAVCTESADAFFENNVVYRPHEESRLYGALL